MFLGRSHLVRSIQDLSTVHPFFGTVFLAMKEARLPVGSAYNSLNFTETVEKVLEAYYQPLAGYNGFYSPFKTSNKANRWQGERYASTTLQRITVDTFGDAFIHTKGSQQWGWLDDYLDILVGHITKRIPLFPLVAWLYRQDEIPEGKGIEWLFEKFFNQFHINNQEAETLFDWRISKRDLVFYPKPLTDSEVLSIIGYPQGAKTSSNGILGEIELLNVGPGPYIGYKPSERLNLITGDNSLGKTFLFDCIWWALTKQWPGYPAQPHVGELMQASIPQIVYQLKAYSGLEERSITVSASYERDKQRWREPKTNAIEAGLAIYARIDGAFVIWDATTRELGNASATEKGGSLYLDERAVWAGLPNEKGGQLCNGLIQDWTTWQRSGDYYSQEWKALDLCLRKLSPDAKHPLRAGRPERISVDDTRDIPVIKMPYGNVPVIHASAGVRRILALAYMLVWTWYRHRSNAKLLGQVPQYRLIIIIDEAEAHLHPRWQRAIVPALMAAIKSLEDQITPQIHLATHSPLVMASAEEVFDEDCDSSHHLQLTESGQVEMKELDFYKRGTADRWLVSDEFDLKLPRSRSAEEAISQALAIQKEVPNNITQAKVVAIDQKLRDTLGERDEFWPRWLYFAQQHGVEE